MELSEKIDDFLKKLKSHPQDYNMSEIMSELEDELRDLKEK